MCARMSVETSLIIYQNWQQHKCLSTLEWTDSAFRQKNSEDNKNK